MYVIISGLQLPNISAQQLDQTCDNMDCSTGQKSPPLSHELMNDYLAQCSSISLSPFSFSRHVIIWEYESAPFRKSYNLQSGLARHS